MATEPTLEDLDAQILALEVERTQLHAAKAPIDARLAVIQTDLRPLQESADRLRLAVRPPPDWPSLIRALSRTGRDARTLRELAAAQLEAYDMTVVGRWSDTGECAFRILALPGPESRARILAGLQLLAPLLKPTAVGAARFGIIEESHADAGVFSLLVWPDRSELQVTSWGRTKVLARFKTLEDAVARISERHPYERK